MTQHHITAQFKLISLQGMLNKNFPGALFPRSPISLCTQTHSVAGRLCSDRPSAQSETRCWESPMDSSPHSRGSTQRGRGWLDSLWTVVAKSTLNATSCQSPRPLSVRKGNEMRLKRMQIIVVSLMHVYWRFILELAYHTGFNKLKTPSYQVLWLGALVRTLCLRKRPEKM